MDALTFNSNNTGDTSNDHRYNSRADEINNTAAQQNNIQQPSGASSKFNTAGNS